MFASLNSLMHSSLIKQLLKFARLFIIKKRRKFNFFYKKIKIKKTLNGAHFSSIPMINEFLLLKSIFKLNKNNFLCYNNKNNVLFIEGLSYGYCEESMTIYLSSQCY